ncbi:hypothetical protein TMatcc_002826 [Talaromyces marneffei ATCC 18224]|nr:hypothetical protein EYB25_000264 [Talaromyces marneffei]
MAEVLGLLSSIATLVELSAKIAGLSYSYAREVKNAPKTQKQYLQEVSALIEVLYRVEQAVAESETGSASQPERRCKFRALFTDYLSSCILVTTTSTYKKVSLVHHEQDRNLLLTWIPKPNIPLRQKPSPCPGTGDWFLDSVAVQKWLSRPTELLWCHGPPGVGKSFLASVMIDHLLKERKQSSLVIYFFCDFSSQNQVKTIDILHYLLRQIIDQASGEMLSTFKDSCGDPNTLQTTTQVVELIALAASGQPIYLVLDGLDELKTPNELLWHILELVKSDIHILITSRDLPQIRKKMNTAIQLDIEPTESDLRLYVTSRLQESDFAEEVTKDSSLIDDILSKTGNIFLLSRLLLDELLDLVTFHQIRKALQRPPQGLQQGLEATLQRIDAQPRARKRLARRLLGWITIAERRLQLDEIVTAFAVEDGEELHPDNMPSPIILLQVCAGLVVLNKHDNTLGLVHAFAHEVLHVSLPEKEIHLDMARTCLRYLSLKPLVAGPCTSSTEMIKRFESLAFLEYSSKYWGQHAVLGDCEEGLEPLIMNLLDNPRLRNSAFQALEFRQEFAKTGVAEELFQSLPTNHEALHLAAYWDLTHIAGRILEAGAPPSPLDSHKWTPLHWACANNKFAVAELLINSRANVNAQDIQGWSPLFWGAFIGNIRMVRLLLSNGANHLVRSTLGWTALHWAISGGHTEIVKELLDHHSQSKSAEPAFHKMTMKQIDSYANATLPVDVASGGQDADIFTLLIDHLQTPGGMITDTKFNMIWEHERFDVPVSLNPWRTMTKGERINGRESNIPRFTGNYADKSEEWRSDPKKWKSVLLLSAIRDQQLSSVELLVKAGADVDYESALCVAACRQDPRYVQCLLKNGADPNIKNKFGRTALHEAVMNGFMETIAALLDGGADIDESVTQISGYRMKDSKNEIWLAGYTLKLSENGSTVLIQAGGFYQPISAIYKQRNSELATRITQLLLSRGASARLKDLSGRTALHYSMLRPHLPLIRLLIEAGCPVDAVDCNGSTPLHLLALRREEVLDMHELKETVQLLLNGKFENQQRNILDQPVRATSAGDGEPDSKRGNNSVLYKTIVREEIIGQYTQIKTVKGFDEGLTPLTMALQAGRWELVQVLLELGATFPAEFDLTPILDLAIQSVEPSITSLLLHHGAHPSPCAIIILAKSFVTRTTDAKTLEEKDTIAKNFKTILKKLVSAGADINFCQNEESPMTLVAKNGGSESVLNAFLNCGADFYTPSSKTFDPILTSALLGEAKDIAFLLDYAVAHPKEDHWSKHLIKVSNETDYIMRLCLCLQKADAINCTNNDGHTLLHLAAEQGHIALVTALVSCGAKIDIADDKGWLAIHSAGFAKQTAVLKFLLEQSTVLPTKMQEILNKDDNTSMKHTMLQVATMDANSDMVSFLLSVGMDPNSTFRYWEKEVPLLGYAAEYGYGDILSLLLHHGADVEKGDEYSWRPLHLACYNSHTEIAKILVEAGADVHAATVAWNNPNTKPTGIYKGDSWTGQPLHLAAMSGQTDIIKLLLEKRVDIHASTGVDANSSYHCPGHGPTALHLALDTGLFYSRRGQELDHGRLQIAQWLVERGAMVRSVIRKYSLQDILSFRDFPDLWDALVAGDRDEESNT